MNARSPHPFALEAIRGRGLDGADLKDANLAGASLIAASLRGATLAGASLVGADLSGADLSGADLSGADLTGADLSSADLTKADLRNADLCGTNLAGARCIRADFRGVTVEATNQTDADFEDARVDGSWLWHHWRVEDGVAHQKSSNEWDSGCPFCGQNSGSDYEDCPHFVLSFDRELSDQPVTAEGLGWPKFPPTFTPADLSATRLQQHLGDLSTLLRNYSETDDDGWIGVDDYSLSRDVYALVTPPFVSVTRSGHLDIWEMLFCPDHEDRGAVHAICDRLSKGLAAVLEETPAFARAVEKKRQHSRARSKRHRDPR